MISYILTDTKHEKAKINRLSRYFIHVFLDILSELSVLLNKKIKYTHTHKKGDLGLVGERGKGESELQDKG